MSNEQTALLSGSNKKDDSNNGATDANRSRAPPQRASRFGPDIPSNGVRISRNTVSQFGILPTGLDGVPRQRKSLAAVGGETKKRAAVKSFMQGPDGAVSDMSKLVTSCIAIPSSYHYSGT